jgi:outer membrane receptor protein involved in Fe transport
VPSLAAVATLALVSAVPNLEDVEDIGQVSLEDLLNGEVRIASPSTPQGSRETPGIVSVVTREEIVNSGARDLIDALSLVPGLSFGSDVEGVVDLAIRGNWGHEGKFLLLIDGEDFIEPLYASLEFGNHFPVDNIERIEVIRGPGSVIYGGYAELAVINVITRTPKNLDGFSVSTTLSAPSSTDFERRNLNLYYGQEFESVPGLSVSAALLVGQGQRSTLGYTDFSGNSYPMSTNSALDPLFLNASVSYKDLHLRAIYDDYRMATRDGNGPVEPQAWSQRFRSAFLDLYAEIKPIEGLVITPRVDYKLQIPWEITDPKSDLYFQQQVSRLYGSLTASYEVVKGGDVLEALNVLVGVQAYQDHALIFGTHNVGYNSDFSTATGGTSPTVDYSDVAVLAEVLARSRYGNLTLGARDEYQTYLHNSFVPRAAYTLVLDRWHLKVLASQAFKTPSIYNIDLNFQILPETTTVYEVESGYHITDHVFATVNAYSITISHPIVWGVPATMPSGESYFNEPQTGTNGVEAQLRIRYPSWYLNASYSFYTGGSMLFLPSHNQTPELGVPGDDGPHLALPQHTLTVNAAIMPWKGLVIDPWFVLTSPRNGYFPDPANAAGSVGSLPTSVRANLFVSYRDLGVPGFDLGVGVFNLFDVRDGFVEATYHASALALNHPMIPGMPRTYMLRMGLTQRF